MNDLLLLATSDGLVVCEHDGEEWCVAARGMEGCHVTSVIARGGVLRSDDRGATWRLADGSSGEPSFGRPPASLVHPDVHSIAVHPSSPDLVFAPTGGGLYRSDDGGKTWDHIHDHCYCRAVWVD